MLEAVAGLARMPWLLPRFPSVVLSVTQKVPSRCDRQVLADGHHKPVVVCCWRLQIRVLSSGICLCWPAGCVLWWRWCGAGPRMSHRSRRWIAPGHCTFLQWFLGVEPYLEILARVGVSHLHLSCLGCWPWTRVGFPHDFWWHLDGSWLLQNKENPPKTLKSENGREEMSSWQVMCSQFDLWLDPTCGFARCRPYGVFCLCHLDLALRPMNISQIWGCLACRWPPCLPRVFCRVLALAVCQPLAVMLDLIRVVQFHGSPSLFILGLPFWHLVPPLNREGALVLRLRSRRIPSKHGLFSNIGRWSSIHQKGYVYIYIHTHIHPL